MKNVYYQKLVNERDKLEKSALFTEIIDYIRKRRNLYSEYCNTSKDDVRFFQGHVQAYDDIVGKGDTVVVIDIILKKVEKALLKKS